MQYRCFHYCNVWTIIWHAKFNLLFLCPYPNICFFLLHCETLVKTSLGRDVQHEKRPQQRCQWKVVEILLAVLSWFSLRVQASPGVGSCFQQMHCPGATWKDLETHMCSEVAPRQFVNSTEKGCHGEKNISERTWFKAGRRHSSSSSYQKPVSHRWPQAASPLAGPKRLPAPAHLMVGLSLCTTVLSALCLEKKN